MKISTFPQDWAIRNQTSSWLDDMARRHLFRILGKLEHGFLRISEGDQTWEFGNAGSTLRADAVIVHPSFYRMILLHGSIGAGEAYMSGCWFSPDLTRVIQVICRNISLLDRMEGGLSRVTRGLDRIQRALIPNSLKGARRNIRAHYDLSNDLFETFLDERMMYSSADFRFGATDLESAQLRKLQRLAAGLEINPNDHVVEIGTGWGGMAIFLAEQYGCRVTTTTISREQYEYAVQKVSEKNLGHLVTVLDRDYRKLEGQFDKLISVEMIEAVGQEYMTGFFRKCDSLLKPGGHMVIQAITMPEQRFELAADNVDFIQKYIFPGGFLPSVELMLRESGKHTRLQVHGLDDIGLDYAETLKHWRKRFLANRSLVEELGFDDLFMRMWEFYFCYCEGGFRERTISTVQMSFRRV